MASSEPLDRTTRRRRTDLIAGACVLAVLAALPFLLTDTFAQNVLVLMLLYTGLSQAWNLLGGYCGQISLGQAVHFGVGAYVSTLLFTELGITPWLGMLAAGIVSALLGLLIGWPCFRLRGHYYSLATVVIAQTALLLFVNWDWVGGALGILIPIEGDSWAKLQFQQSKTPYCLVCLGFAVAAWLATWWIEGSKVGYCWRAVKDDAEAARSLGVGVFRHKMTAAAVSGFFTGVGGAIFAQYVSYIDPDSVLGFQLSLLMALPAVLGGIGTLWGPLVGAAVLIPLAELTRTYVGGTGAGLDLVLYGLLVMVVAAIWPQGLVGIAHALSRRRKRRRPVTAAADA